MVRASSFAAVSFAMVVACSSPGGGNEPLSTSAGLDVSGASNAPCTLTISGNGIPTTTTFDIAPPTLSVTDAPVSVRPSLTFCMPDKTALVSVAPNSECVVASRTSTQLCFFQNGCLGAWQTADRSCPVKLTLTCNGQKLYDDVPWSLCEWYG